MIGLGPSFMKIWTWEALHKVGPEMPERGSKCQWCQLSEQILEFFSAQSKRFPVGHDWWPWTKPGYITMTWRQSNDQSTEWRHSGSPRPKKFHVQKSAGKVLASIFRDQDGILLIDFLPKGQTINAEYYSSLLVQLKDILNEKRWGKFTKGSCPCTTIPWFTGHLQPKRNWPIWASNVLITHPILRIWPRRTTTCSLDWKSNWKVAIFHPTRRSLLPWRPGWMDNLLNCFLSGLQKLEQRAKKRIELRGEYAE